MMTLSNGSRTLWLAMLPWLLLACGGDGSGEAPRAAEAPAVEVLEARAGTLPLEERLSGQVKARDQVIVRPEIEAQVVEVMVESGEAVERAQPLVRLDGRTLEERLRQAEAAVRLAAAEAAEARARLAELEAQVVRTRALAGEDLVSELELETREAQLAAAEASAEQAEARVDEAQATAEERRAALAKTLVRSPVAGRVGQRRAEVGMLVDPQTALFVVGGLEELRVEVPLSEGMLGHLREGQPVRIASPALEGEPLSATLSRISPFLAEDSFSTLGEIDFDNPEGRLRPGMLVTVDVLYGESERSTLVPTSAVWDDPRTGVRGVYVVDLQGAEPPAAGEAPSSEPYGVSFRPVEVLAEGRATAGVAGVDEGEWVVTVGQQLLSGDEGATARVRATTWERLLELQGLQREDLLEGFLEKQQRLARSQGIVPPPSDALLGKGAGP